MEIMRWALLAGKGGSTSWLLLATVGFCAVFLAAALCVKSAVARRHGEGKVSSSVGRGWGAVKNKVMSAVRKGGFLKHLRDDDGGQVVSFLREAEEGDRISTATPPPLWQKKIIMGEKCELPSFSGLILYDENGKALPHARKTDFR